MKTNNLTTIKHPISGEIYAAEIRDDGAILQAYGPLRHDEPTDPDSIEQILANNADTAGDEAVWLQGEIAAK